MRNVLKPMKKQFSNFYLLRNSQFLLATRSKCVLEDSKKIKKNVVKKNVNKFLVENKKLVFECPRMPAVVAPLSAGNIGSRRFSIKN